MPRVQLWASFQMIKAIIFDFDGVILESAEIKTDAFRQLFEERFPDSIDEIVEYHKKNMGISRFVKFRHIYKQFADKSLRPEEETLLGEEFSKIVFDQVLAAPMVIGAIQFLKENQQNYLLFVASGTPKDELVDIMKKRDLLPYFREVFGSPEEKADIVRRIMKTYGLHASEIAFVGDAESDYNAAKSTRVHFIEKTTSSSTTLNQHGYRVSNLDEMNEVLTQLKKDLYASTSRKASF